MTVTRFIDRQRGRSKPRPHIHRARQKRILHFETERVPINPGSPVRDTISKGGVKKVQSGSTTVVESVLVSDNDTY